MDEKHPISKYIGIFPNGHWVFIEEVIGTYAQTMARAQELQEQDPENAYRIWDPR